MRRGSRGQASPITVVILVGLVIAMALGLYALTQSSLARAQFERGVESVRFTVASNVDVVVVSSSSETAPDGVRVYCYLVSLSSRATGPLTVYLTVLPGGARETSFSVGEDIDIIPLDYGGPDYQARVNVLVFTVADVNGDSIAGIVDPAQGVEITTAIPPCATVRNDDNLRPAGAPAEMVTPDALELGEGLTLDSILRLHNIDPAQYMVPLWKITLQPGGSTLLYIYVEAEDQDTGSTRALQAIAATLHAQLTGKYYYARAVGLAAG